MKAILASLAALAGLIIAQQRPDVYQRHNLVSDLPAQADVMDTRLINPWGIAAGATTPFWIANNGTGTATVYNTQGHPFPEGNPIVVTIPSTGAMGSHGEPTGVVFNNTMNFVLPSGGPALFLFATGQGAIVGWNQSSGTNAVQVVNRPGAVFKGLAIAHEMSGDFLFAANFKEGQVDMFDANFGFVKSFTDISVPPGFAPFNVANIGGKLFVSFAQQDDRKEEDVPGAGHGFVSVFLPDGTFQGRFVSNGPLNSPWAMVVAPGNFGAFSNALLVGNFGDGTINAFNLSNGGFLGTILGPSNRPMVIEGLWGLIFGNGGNGGDPNVLYFTAGIPGPTGEPEDHGLFGSISPQHP